MGHIIVSNEKGDIIVPHEVLSFAKPNQRYEVQPKGNVLMIVPEADIDGDVEVELKVKQFKEWVNSFQDWLDKPRPKVPSIPNEALSRENIYD